MQRLIADIFEICVLCIYTAKRSASNALIGDIMDFFVNQNKKTESPNFSFGMLHILAKICGIAIVIALDKPFSVPSCMQPAIFNSIFRTTNFSSDIFCLCRKRDKQVEPGRQQGIKFCQTPPPHAHTHSIKL